MRRNDRASAFRSARARRHVERNNLQTEISEMILNSNPDDIKDDIKIQNYMVKYISLSSSSNINLIQVCHVMIWNSKFKLKLSNEVRVKDLDY
jgi:hypothetical protein